VLPLPQFPCLPTTRLTLTFTPACKRIRWWVYVCAVLPVLSSGRAGGSYPSWLQSSSLPMRTSWCSLLMCLALLMRLCSWRFCCRLFLHYVVPPRRTWLGPWIYFA
jgi:hypothetical protein